MTKYYRNKPPKEGMVRVGYKWMTEEEAETFIDPKVFDPTKNKEICRLYKHRSPYMHVFQISSMNKDGEDWFIMYAKVKKRTKAVKYSYTLIRKDIGSCIRGLISMEKCKEPIWAEDYQDIEENQKLFNLDCI